MGLYQFFLTLAQDIQQINVVMRLQQHQTNQMYDEQRTIELNRCGFQVLRFWNNDVLREINTVLEVIDKALSPTLSREVALRTIHAHGAGEGADRSI